MAISGARAANDEVSIKDAKVEIDLTPSSSSYADISSWGTSVAVEGGETPSENQKTFSGDPIVLVGDKDPFRLTVTCIYTEDSTDPFNNIWDAYETSGGFAADIRYSPKGGSSGDNQFTTSGGKVISCTAPQGPAGESSANTFQFIVEAGSLARSAVA